MSSMARERHLSNVSRKKSRRMTHMPGMEEIDEHHCKRFQYELHKYCEEQYYTGVLPLTIAYQRRENGEPILLDPHAIGGHSNEEMIFRVYNDPDNKLRTFLCRNDSSTQSIPKRLFVALIQTFVRFTSLVTIKLEYCNLGNDHCSTLAEGVKKLESLQELVLTGNPRAKSEFYQFIFANLKSLRLAFCELSGEQLRAIAEEYLNRPSDVSTLIHLDLSHNPIFDDGCQYLATILRCDRSLRSLKLTDCKIGDAGLATIIESFAPQFPLTDEELVLRRRIRLQYYKMHMLYKMSESESDDISVDTVAIERCMISHPFVAQSEEKDGQVFCHGNDTLETINLAYNHLSASALGAFLRTLTDQIMVFGSDKGIKRAVLEGNASGYEDVACLILDLLFSKALRKSISSESKFGSTTKRRKSSVKSQSSGNNPAVA